MIRPSQLAQYGRLFATALKRRGLLTTLQIAYHEVSFDWRYGVETKDYVEAEDIVTDSVHKGEGHKYAPLQVPFFWRVFGAGGPVPDRATYIDFGCGKGRTLILAALAGFESVIGVEYSQELADHARLNVQRFGARTGSTTRFEVVHADATQYAIPDQASTLVFYDPFDVSVLKRVLDNVEASLARAPRDLWIVYFYCLQHSKDALAAFEPVVEFASDTTWVCRRRAPL